MTGLKRTAKGLDKYATHLHMLFLGSCTNTSTELKEGWVVVMASTLDEAVFNDNVWGWCPSVAYRVTDCKIPSYTETADLSSFPLVETWLTSNSRDFKSERDRYASVTYSIFYNDTVTVAADIVIGISSYLLRPLGSITEPGLYFNEAWGTIPFPDFTAFDSAKWLFVARFYGVDQDMEEHTIRGTWRVCPTNGDVVKTGDSSGNLLLDYMYTDMTTYSKNEPVHSDQKVVPMPMYNGSHNVWPDHWLTYTHLDNRHASSVPTCQLGLIHATGAENASGYLGSWTPLSESRARRRISPIGDQNC